MIPTANGAAIASPDSPAASIPATMSDAIAPPMSVHGTNCEATR